MRIELSGRDRERFEGLREIQKMNLDVLAICSRYLREDCCLIKKDTVDEIVRSCQVTEEYAYLVLLAAACGLDMEGSERDLQIARRYLGRSIKKLDPRVYLDNSYYKNVRIADARFGAWELKNESYQPYEAFVYNDILVDQDFTEVPRLGFFDETFHFPAVLESGNEWMLITPNEIETMRSAVEGAHGRVITFGLGLGYFAYMVSGKEQVRSVTVIEKDEAVNELFREHLLPQFPNREKIELISADAFDYVRSHMAEGKFDYAFVDLWHDVSDGVDIYLKMKRLEDLSPKTEWQYWIERSLLSNLRCYVFEAMLDGMQMREASQDGVGCDDKQESCPREYARRLKAVKSYFEGKTIGSFDEVVYYLGDEFLKNVLPVEAAFE
jgi:hypothetical protein